MYRFTITVSLNMRLGADVLEKILTQTKAAFLLRHRIAWALEKTVNEARGRVDCYRFPVESVTVERIEEEKEQ